MPPATTPTLTTARLTLRPYQPADEAAFVRLATDPVVMAHVGDGVLSEAAAQALFKRVFEVYEAARWQVWAVEARATGRLLGSAEIKPMREPGWEGDQEIIYLMEAPAWGRGLGTEIAAAVTGFGFDVLGLPRVMATVDYVNAPSIRILTRLGMRFVRELRDDIGAYALYGVDRAAWEAGPFAAPGR